MTDSKTQKLFGVKLLAAVFLNAKTLFLSALIFGVLGLCWSLSELDGYTYEATLGVGLLYPGEPIEKPQKTIVKIRSAGMKPVNYDLEQGNVSVSMKPSGHRKNYGPIFDIKVNATTSSAALAMFSSIKTEILRTHQQTYDFEKDINQSHVEMSKLRARFLRDQLSSENALLNDTNEGLLLALKDASSAESLSLRFQTPPTQLLRSDLEPTAILNRKIAFTVIGLILGLILGAVFIMVKTLIQNEDGSDDKAVFESFNTFVLQYRAAVIFGLIIGVLLSALLFLKLGNKTVSTSVLQVANVAPYGPFSDVQSMQLFLKDKMERLNVEICNEKCKVEVLSVRTRPSPYAPSDIVEVRATGASAKTTQKIVTKTSEFFLRVQSEDYKEALQMQRDKVKQLEADLARLVETDSTNIDQNVTVGFIRDITKSKRYMNPTRTYPAKVLMPTFSVKQSTSKYLLILLVIGAIAGLAMGLVFGLIQAAFKEARGAS